MAGMSDVDILMSPRFDRVRRSTYVALDVATEAEALAIVSRLSPAVDGFKVGLELFHRLGMGFVERLLKQNLRVFLDMKLHDIPNTVAGAMRAICDYPIEMVNVHASGGTRMLAAAKEAVERSAYQPLLIGVTVLTSLDAPDLVAIGQTGSPEEAVLRLTDVTLAAGLDGVVCSAQELAALQGRVPESFERVVPGTRLASDHVHDQRRTCTPNVAMSTGATRLVLGRAVVQAEDPLQAIESYWLDMMEGVASNDGTISR